MGPITISTAVAILFESFIDNLWSTLIWMLAIYGFHKSTHSAQSGNKNTQC